MAEVPGLGMRYLGLSYGVSDVGLVPQGQGFVFSLYLAGVRCKFKYDVSESSQEGRISQYCLGFSKPLSLKPDAPNLWKKGSSGTCTPKVKVLNQIVVSVFFSIIPI